MAKKQLSADWEFTATASGPGLPKHETTGRARLDWWERPLSLEDLLSDRHYLKFARERYGDRDVARFIIKNIPRDMKLTRSEKIERIAKLFGMRRIKLENKVNRSGKVVYKRR